MSWSDEINHHKENIMDNFQEGSVVRLASDISNKMTISKLFVYVPTPEPVPVPTPPPVSALAPVVPVETTEIVIPPLPYPNDYDCECIWFDKDFYLQRDCFYFSTLKLV